MGKRKKREEQMGLVHPNAAGLDIGAQEIWGSVPSDREGETVKMFCTFTPDLHRLADLLVACHMTIPITTPNSKLAIVTRTPAPHQKSLPS